MDYTTKDLIEFATAKNAVDFTAALNNILGSKVHEKIMSSQEDIARNIYKTGYQPHNSDEQKFMDKHIPHVVDYPVDNENGLPFKDEALHASGPDNNTPASYGKGEDEEVYEETDHLIERHLTKPELRKREQVALAIAKKFPNMDIKKKMAIATKTAKESA